LDSNELGYQFKMLKARRSLLIFNKGWDYFEKREDGLSKI